ncbi:hypothetical protein LB450_08440 [Psychroflexus sp. CAK1W]|uniref:NUMOD1 domain-containing DNA-binding protein n=1 Tax=Psychroflexus curvus TaxID=2873595 RepID=UPI001CCC55B4|nr:NUMOD1 domain-containing DNA-binding protein [Psychroflexus curvus]MBZ9628124.1 hypothetical protein [Psychroflexus curvus]
MDYLKAYKRIVSSAKREERSGYLELHHIIPKCIFGENLLNENGIDNVNQESNLVYLTAREHFVCHWLLNRAFPKNKKLGLAFWAMVGMISPDHKRDYTPSSRAISEARTAATNARKIPILQYNLKGDFIREFKSLNAASKAVGIVPNAIGQNLNSFTKSAGSFQWRFRTKNYQNKIESYIIENNGLPIGQYDLQGNLINSYKSMLDAERKTGHSEGSIRASMNRGAKIKDTSYFFIQFNKHQEIPKTVESFEIPIQKFSIPVVQISSDGKNFVNEFPSITHAQNFFNRKKSHISDVCNGKRNTAFGFKWLYKNDYKKDLPKIPMELASRKVYSKNVAQYSLDGEYIKTHKNPTEASKETNCSTGNIISVINGKRKSSGGYIWAYIKNGKIPRIESIPKANNMPKAIIMLDKEKNEVLKTYESIAEAAEAVNGSRSNISACINGRKKTAYGYKWKFK